MGLDFHDANDARRADVLFSLSHDEFLKLRETFFVFKALSGVEIDEYGTTKLSSEEVQKLIGCLGNRNKKLKNFLEGVQKRQAELVLEGD